jgi:hypothetical protein
VKNHRINSPGPGTRSLDPAERQAQQRAHADRARTLLAAASKKAGETSTLERPGISTATRTRFAIRAKPSEWLFADAGRAVIDAIFECIKDGSDRVVMTWPEPPGGAFVAACVALREARGMGHLAHASFAYWPWRDGATWAARLVLVNPSDIAAAARSAINDAHSKDWKRTDLAHNSLEMIEIRLRDLDLQMAASPGRPLSDASIIVRSPTVLETTAVFAPVTSKAAPPYGPSADKILRRVRRHTFLGERNAGLGDRFDHVGDPMKTPFALLGLPPAKRAEELARFVQSERVRTFGMDVVIVDLTRPGRSELPDQWEPRLEALLKSFDVATGRRPAALVLTEDAFTFRRATRVMKASAAVRRPRGRVYEIGAYLDHRGLLGPAAKLPSEMPAIAFQADIKDASLAPLRDRLVVLGRALREDAHAGAAVVSRTLAFLRRSASLPIGLSEAREITDILYDADDEVDSSVRAMFRPKMVLGALLAVAEIAPAYSSEIRSLVEAVGSKVGEWESETPVSLKLASLLEQSAWNAASTVIAFPDRRIAETYLASDRAVRCDCTIIDHKGIADLSEAAQVRRIVVIGPGPQAIRALLTTKLAPETVLLLGDAAGSALLSAELAPLGRIAAFASIAARAKAITEALRRGGTNETLDLAEAEFRIVVTDQEERIDLTQANEAYRGPVVEIRTQRGQILRYRPTSDVLLLSPGEARPFERVVAREIEAGDSILVLKNDVRELIRRAIAGSRRSLAELGLYHQAIAGIRRETPGTTVRDKARHVLRSMQAMNGSVPDSELHNITRWLSADDAPMKIDGARQPGAARDWPRFLLFMHTVGIQDTLAKAYWDAAITPSRSYRAQEGHLFNQRVVQFILDPEATTAWASMRDVWQEVLEGVDAVVDVVTSNEGGRNG